MHESKIFDPYYATLEWTNMALTEIYHLSIHRPNHEIDIVNSDTFMFYRVSLQYMYVSDYCKLLNNYNEIKSTHHAASFFKLIRDVLAIKGNAFASIFEKLRNDLLEIRKTDYYKTMKDNRDQRFSHFDSNSRIGPDSVPGLTEEEINVGFSQLRVLYRILNECASLFDIEFVSDVPNDNGTTNNFIKFQAEYKKYYFDNYLKIKKEQFKNEGI